MVREYAKRRAEGILLCDRPFDRCFTTELVELGRQDARRESRRIRELLLDEAPDDPPADTGT